MKLKIYLGLETCLSIHAVAFDLFWLSGLIKNLKMNSKFKFGLKMILKTSLENGKEENLSLPPSLCFQPEQPALPGLFSFCWPKPSLAPFLWPGLFPSPPSRTLPALGPKSATGPARPMPQRNDAVPPSRCHTSPTRQSRPLPFTRVRVEHEHRPRLDPIPRTPDSPSTCVFPTSRRTPPSFIKRHHPLLPSLFRSRADTTPEP